MSDSPRTDAAVGMPHPPQDQLVTATFARQLERENTELRARIAELGRGCGEPVAWANEYWLGELAAGRLDKLTALLHETASQQIPLYTTPPNLAAIKAEGFEQGWRLASEWANRADLTADIGSPAYIKERDEAIRKLEV